MIKRNPCTVEGCNYPRFAKGYCKVHQSLRTDKKKPKKTIKPISDKRIQEMNIYRKRRDRYMEKHEICEVKGCNNKSNDLHHKKSRLGSLLYDEKYFFACCRSCHQKIELNPVWAKENGYSLDRLT